MSFKGISPLISVVLLVAITLTATIIVGTFLMSLSTNASSTIKNQTEERLSCTFADFYIINATYDMNLDCTEGRKHTINLTVKNNGQVSLSFKSFSIEDDSGNVYQFGTQASLAPGEIKVLTNVSYSHTPCLALIEQKNTSAGYETHIKNIYLSPYNCPNVRDRIDEDFVTVVNANATETQPTTYSAGLWHFNEDSGTTIADSSGNGNTGTYHGESFNDGTLKNGPQWVDGKYGKALQFDGSDDYVDCGNDSSLNLDNEVTVEAWVKPIAVPSSGEGLASKADLSYGLTYYVNGQVYFYTYSGSHFSTTSLPTGEWSHVVGTYDGTTRRLYVNGVLKDEDNDPGLSLSSSAKFKIGYYSGYFNGLIDEVRIYNRALSEAEIKAIYQNNTFIRDGLVAYWRFDEGSGTTAHDTHHIAKSDNKEGSIFGNALSFDGVDDYVEVPDSDSLDITDEITVEAWVKLKEVAGGQRQKIIAGKFDGDYDPYALIYDNVDHYVGFKLSANSVTVPHYSYTPDNKWHHLVGTYDGKDVKFYFDGELKASIPNSGLIKSRTNSVTIGGWTGQTRFINGTIDEVHIYNRALSAEEIYDHYIRGLKALG